MNKKPGNNLMGIGFLIGILATILLIVGANSTDQYGVHHGPTAISVLVFVLAVVLVVVGFARRLLAAVEKRNQ